MIQGVGGGRLFSFEKQKSKVYLSQGIPWLPSGVRTLPWLWAQFLARELKILQATAKKHSIPKSSYLASSGYIEK